jgi:hypothetical protein
MPDSAVAKGSSACLVAKIRDNHKNRKIYNLGLVVKRQGSSLESEQRQGAKAATTLQNPDNVGSRQQTKEKIRFGKLGFGG